jgi:hypothetical protein
LFHEDKYRNISNSQTLKCRLDKAFRPYLRFFFEI